MKPTTKFKVKGFEEKQSHPILDRSKGYTENILTPVTLSGVVASWNKSLGGGRTSDYKLVSYSDLEYFIVADSEWRDVLSHYFWEEVKVIGLLNISNMTLIPQKVYPKGPTGEKEYVIDLPAWKSKALVKKLIKNINDLVAVPAAVWAEMVS
ncbi:MAG: hypothetical protein JNM39_04425 [Bdellovibrionaceae bacterium]|nr:hypothetical protein [Pseudobdellovibrionaceae bacterium]